MIRKSFALLLGALLVVATALTVDWLYAEKEDGAPLAKTSFKMPEIGLMDESIFSSCLCQPCGSSYSPLELVKTNSPTVAMASPAPPVSGGSPGNIVSPPSGLTAVGSQPYSGVRLADGSLRMET